MDFLNSSVVQLFIAGLALLSAVVAIAKLAVDAVAKQNAILLENNHEFSKQIVDSQKEITVMLENHLTTLYNGQNRLLERTAVLLDRTGPLKVTTKIETDK